MPAPRWKFAGFPPGLPAPPERNDNAPVTEPASAWTFVRRNPVRVLPVAGVLALATFLLAGLLPLVRSLEANIYRNVGVFDGGVFVTETNRLAFERLSEEDFLAVPGVVACRRLAYFPIDMELFIGTMEFAITGLSPEGMRHAMERKGMMVGEGRLPRPGRPEVALSGDILVSRGLRIGDALEGLSIVGRLDGPSRLGVFPLDAADAPEASFDYKRGFWTTAAPGAEARVAAELEAQGLATAPVAAFN